MIIIGIDDTDVAGSPGTNQLARRIVRELSGYCRCLRIVRHQLLDDLRVPCTTKNGSASILLEWRRHPDRSSRMSTAKQAVTAPLLGCCRRVMRDWFVEGSDPGLCLLSGSCPSEIVRWGQRCQRELVTREDALVVARDAGLHLESLGGTEDGVIGALAAVGLASTENDGRIVQLGEWPDNLSGAQRLNTLNVRGVRVCEYSTDQELTHGTIDVGKHLRPNLRHGEPLLFVEALHAASDHPLKTDLRQCRRNFSSTKTAMMDSRSPSSRVIFSAIVLRLLVPWRSFDEKCT